MKTPYCLFLLLTLLSFGSCNEPKHITEVLHRAEALMYTSPDSALQMLEAIPYPERLTGETQADYALLLTQARSRCRITATSDSLIQIAVKYYQCSNHNARKAKSYLYLADVYMDMQKYPEAMTPLKQAEEVLADAEADVQSLVYGNLGYLNRKSGNYKLTRQYYLKALDIDKKNGNIEWVVANLTNILNLPLQEIQDSLASYLSQMENILFSARPDLQAKAYNNIGVLFYKRKQMSQAADYFQKAIRSSASVVPYRAYLNLARIYDEEGNGTRADSLYQVALQSPVWATKARIFEALYNRSIHAKRYQEAAAYMKHYQQATDSFYTNRQTKEIQELQAKYDYEVLARSKAEAENNLLRICILSFAFFTIVVLWVYWLKKRHLRQLQELDSLIQRIKAMEGEKEEMTYLVDTLNASLARSKVLSNEYLRIKGEWTTFEDIQSLGVYIRLQRDLSLYTPSADVALLGHWLDMVSNQFASRLREAHPNLTITELCLCYLHKMGYTVNEMSQAMHIKPDSIKRYIYRACANMGISQSREDFTKYISQY